MKVSSLSLALFLFIGGTALADEATNAPPTPNHLVPIAAYDPDGYNQAVFASLLGRRRCEVAMVVLPSFQPEYAMIIRRESRPDGDEGPWVVESVRAKKPIWRWKNIDENTMELDIHVTKDVERHRMEVSATFVELMAQAWTLVLKQTRYAAPDYLGLDGVTYQFHGHYNLFGEMWCPNRGLPLALSELGEKLIELARTGGNKRPALEAECEKRARKIIAGAKGK